MPKQWLWQRRRTAQFREAAGGSSSSSRPKTGTEAGVAGTWLQDNTGWWFQYKDGSYPRDFWVQLDYHGKLEWYHFNEVGYMQTGWYRMDGKWYYFNPESDGALP